MDISRRQLFKRFAGAAALAVMPQLALIGETQAAVPDVTGALLPMDGSYISIKDFPELSAHLLDEETSQLRVLGEMQTPEWITKFGGGAERDALLQELASGARGQVAAHKSIKSPDGLMVRLPQSKSRPVPHGWTDDGRKIWIDYAYFIQARPDETGLPIGKEVIFRNVVVD